MLVHGNSAAAGGGARGPGDATALDARGATLVQRSTLQASLGAGAGGAVGVGPVAAAALAAAALTVQSSFLSVDGGAGNDVAVRATGDTSAVLTLRHATLRSDGAAVALTGTSLDAANSVLDGDPGIDAGAAAPWTRATSLAFRTGTTFAIARGAPASSQADLDSLGCDICLIVEVSAFVDDTGHLTAGDNPLVDAGDLVLSLPDDIDGDVRPQGPLPDVGCDERVP